MKNNNVMSLAWSISREAVKRFGGKPVEYMRGGAVKLAYQQIKSPVVSIEAALLAAGGKEWRSGEKYGNQRRIYPTTKFLLEKLGLTYSPCSVNGWQCWLRGKEISLAQAKAAKRVIENGSFWFDVGAQDFYFERMRTDYGNAIAKTLIKEFKEVR